MYTRSGKPLSDGPGIRQTAVIGAGQMGHGIAQMFALGGYQVLLHDVTEDRVAAGLDRIRENLDTFVAHDLAAQEAASAALERITTTTDLRQAVAGADLILEAVFEDLAVKRQLYAQVEAHCSPEAILASNTSGMMPTDLAAEMDHPQRFLVAHFWKPPHLVRLVEVVAGEKTGEGLAERVCAFMETIGKKPIIVRKEVPGYIGNRIQYAIIREAAHLVAAGVASPQDVDMAITEGFGVRFSFMGVFHIIDLAGVDLAANICSYLLDELDSKGGVPQPLVDKIESGDLGTRTGQGFYDWTPESEAEMMQKWNKALITQLGGKR